MLFKKWLLIILLLMSTAVFAQGKTVFHDSKGNTIQMSQLKNKWVVLTYWAAWCPSCLREVPELNSFYEHNQDKDVLLLAFNFDRLPAKYLKKAVNRASINYPSLVEDPNYMWAELGTIDFVPVTFIINPEGKLAKRFVGSVSERELFVTLQRLKQQYT